MSFRVALSGLNAAQSDLSVTANNIANSSTTGFKSSRAEFAELFSVSPQSLSSSSVGDGVRVSSVAQQFQQGNVDFTDNSLDLAVSGQGFFVVNDGGALNYTRAGAFQLDRDGFLVNSANQRLQVYPALTGGAFNTGGLSDLQLNSNISAPQATVTATIGLNLPSGAPQPVTAPLDPANLDTYNHQTSLTVYDSLGAAHTASLYFVKTANPNEWTSSLYVDGLAVTPAAQTLQFSDAGILTAPAGGTLAFDPHPVTTGAAPLDLTFDLSGATQFGNAFTVAAVTQDGFTTGRLIGIDIGDTGIVQARYTNGRSTPLGQVALANFANPQGLQQVGNTNWAETFASGQSLLGQAGNSGFGLVQSGALEASNVDITQQLVNMITAQRNFQANAQVIQTSDQVTQTIINIR